MNERDPSSIFGLVFTVSSVAGLASLLRSNQPLTVRNTLSAFFNSGLFGLVIAFLWYEYCGGAAHPWFMIGVSLMAGLGGVSMLDFAVQLLQSASTDYVKRLANSLPLPKLGQDDGQKKQGA